MSTKIKVLPLNGPNLFFTQREIIPGENNTAVQFEMTKLFEKEGILEAMQRGLDATQETDLVVKVNFVPIGYYIEVIVDGVLVGGECRDFGGTYETEALYDLKMQLARMVRDCVRHLEDLDDCPAWSDGANELFSSAKELLALVPTEDSFPDKFKEVLIKLKATVDFVDRRLRKKADEDT